MAKYVYFFGNGKADGKGTMKELLGGKGAGLADMTNSGVPVPAGFTITTEVCALFYKNKMKVTPKIDAEIEQNIKKLEKAMDKKLGDDKNPLLLSVRSGAKFSMPGMMDTVLNLGLNDKTVEGLAKLSGNPRFAYDCYRRFIQMFGNVVLGIDKDVFERAIDKKKEQLGIEEDTDLTTEDLKDLIVKFKALVKKQKNMDFPTDPRKQMAMSRDAVFQSWYNPRAATYRKLNKIPGDLGTGVNIQAMVFGNMGNDSGTGVGFTRNPSTGENKFYGEYLLNAQGEDVVAGVRTPLPIDNLKKDMPKVYQQLRRITEKLEKHYKDIQDFEFTIEKGTLFMLQTRIGKRTGPAAVRIAVEMVKEKLINKQEALRRVEPDQLNQLLHPMFDPRERVKHKVMAKGLPASPGAASGKVVFTADEAAKIASTQKVILVRMETSPDDIHGMHVAEGILTARGGMTSHAAVVCRGMGKTCVAGCGSVKINEEDNCFTAGNVKIKKGDYISIDGSSGEVMPGQIPTTSSEIVQVVKGELKSSQSKTYQIFNSLMKWADEVRTLGVRANADVPEDASVARAMGAEGIGLCRTEHMFFAKDRIPAVQKMIMAQDQETREKELKKLLPMQKKDFKGLLKEMQGLPVTIRFLDPPLHEFLPKKEELVEQINKLKRSKNSKAKQVQLQKVLQRVEELHEFNPMLGMRGCRLGITRPEITRMQAQAVCEAVCELKKQKVNVFPEIMIPLVGTVEELKHQKDIVDEVAAQIMKKYKMKFKYLVGTMIELPRAALTANEIAAEAEFFSFGTNDLTQTTLGLSRDDAGTIIEDYISKGIMAEDPFQTLDQTGVGQLVEIGTKKGRSTRPRLKVGICGEHGGDPASVSFCHKIGLNYVSCSPYRVPIARLAAARAALGEV